MQFGEVFFHTDRLLILAEAFCAKLLDKNFSLAEVGQLIEQVKSRLQSFAFYGKIYT
jgi:hypothetical protein